MKQRITRTIGWFAPVALAVAPLSAAHATRAGDNVRFYSPSVALQSGLQRAPQGEDEGIIADLPVWQLLGGVTLVALIVLAVSGGSGSSGNGGYHSNGAN